MRTKKLLMMIALLCTVVQGAWAESVTFNVCSWDDVNKRVVTTTETKDCTVLAGDPGEWMQLGDADDQDHYYVVKGNVSYMTLNCFGRVHLILADDATLTCTGGIKVETANSDAKLFIYGQSQNTGKLIVTNSYKRAAGIGSSEAMGSGVITIHGGTLDVTGGQYAAGIGGGCSARQSKSDGGVVTIYGGNIKVQGGDSGAGIGCGTTISIAGYGDDTKAIVEATFGRFTLYGGTVTATGGEYSAGIGGGGGYQSTGANKKIRGSKCGEIYIYGGTLTAQGGQLGAGIGSGNYATYNKGDSSGKVYISGGTVNATGGENGAGIGGGRKSRGAQVEISGGTVNAKGGSDAAGIGGGEDANGGPLSISGGTVRAEGSEYGAGIGGGEHNVAPQNYYGIGADVTITGGTVIAIAGEKCNGREDYTGSAIGSGKGMHYKDSKDICGSFSIPDNYKVTGGDAEDNPERVFTTDERDGARIWRNYVRIEPCTHTTPTVGSDQTKADTYTIDSDQHTMHCRYCAYTSQENHTFVGNVCSYCGKTNNASDDMWSVTLHRASAATSNSYVDRVVMMVVKGQSFTLPAVSATEGLTLMGYATSWSSGDGIEMKDGETLTAVGTVVTPVTPEDDISYYPRYRYRYVPTWTWNDADATATLSIKCSALSQEAVSVTNITYNTNDDVKTATATYDHNGATYTFTDTYLLPVGSLVLIDASDNEDNLDTYHGRKVNMLRLSGRTLYADGKWNTLCLPFDLNDVYNYLGSCTLKTLDSSAYDSETGTLTLTFIDATSIEAGKPYLIKWTNDDSDRVSPMFYNVVISDADNAVTTKYVDFIGFFSPISLAAGDKTVLYLGADNKLYYPSAAKTVNACRAVFALKGLTADEKAKARAFVLNFGDESTGITTTNDTNDTNSDGAWFTLDGRKLSQKPSQHGIYIKNGKKVVIK